DRDRARRRLPLPPAADRGPGPGLEIARRRPAERVVWEVSLKPCKLIALSASYGAGGDVVGAALAERLGVPLLDRAIPIKAAEQLRVEPEEAAAVESDAPGWLERIMRGWATGGTGLQIVLPGASFTREDFRRETEKLLRVQCESGGGVMVGRAAAVFLRDPPGVLRVRLDGPRDARLRQAIRIGGVDEE